LVLISIDFKFIKVKALLNVIFSPTFIIFHL
jgi:hypothetical protein